MCIFLLTKEFLKQKERRRKMQLRILHGKKVDKVMFNS